MERKPFNPSDYSKYDEPCYQLLEKLCNHLLIEKYYVGGKDVLVDAFCYLQLKGKKKLVCAIELEYNSNFYYPFKFDSMYCYAHKSLKYKNYLHHGLPTFYVKFSHDLKHAAIINFDDIPTHTIFSVNCKNGAYRNDTVNCPLEYVTFCEINKLEYTIVQLLLKKDIK